MDSKTNGFSFTNIRASPTNPHKKPIYINTGNLQNMPGASFNPLDGESHIGNGGLGVALTEPSTSKKYTDYDYITEDNYGKEDKDAKSDRYVWLCKFITGIVVILVAIVGTVYFILYYTHPQVLTITTPTPSRLPQNCTRSQEEIHFKEVFTITCMISVSDQYQLNTLYINYKPQYGSYKPDEAYNLSLTQIEPDQSGWTITVLNSSSPVHINITREPVKCDSGGEYIFRFMAVNSTNSAHEFEVSKHTELITIESKVSDVSLQVKQNNVSGGFYEVSCSAQSACTPAPITLLGVFVGDNSKSAQPIFGSNFTCIINYNDNDGWTVKCTGTIPENVYSSLNSIACRPTTGNQTIDDKKEIEYEICRDCIFECPNDNYDTYWFDHKICNIFHRCFNGHLYTQPCPPATYFNTNSCTCDHTDNLPGKCNDQNERVKQEEKQNLVADEFNVYGKKLY
ncbi:unnamed protein product [Mytilus edulis]|uniref:Chitin-binding type-2 domain-containing protein n=1 Tax=Mytilus edulis TaxID=6550 RepID=A0A8S3U7R9_MYTED|nr:unnamed protein product [Mytilus edulis]